MQKLTKRQDLILQFIRKNSGVQNKHILDYLSKELEEDFGRVTIVRDIDVLRKNNMIKRQGAGRNVNYFEAVDNELLKYIDVDNYCSQDLDKRDILYPSFNFKIFKYLEGLFTKSELVGINKWNNDYRARIKKISPTILKKEIERLTIDLSWKSSQIEGNTYSLLDTEILIKEDKEAKGHKREEAIMILNHKKALDFIFSKKNSFKKLSIKDLENIHSLLIDDLGVKKGMRSNLVGITGTNYKPLDNQYQIKEAVQQTLKIINTSKEAIEKAFIATLMVSYIQPFEDGNKRSSRLLSNAILLGDNYCPLSFRSIDEKEYKKAMILFYEQNKVLYFKELFIEQFEFAVKNYFL
ncbi:MAG: cell filamentation protein Fic [Candidatus Komeilibacteria bacterium CG11_big_fil_rev_8_21_14_0_20_36_20]|uniref:Cell filamentation protein Fic n=1 Tax=Candidatus Komeilibacteria bacterium CG11_big_fil_rev_8_21_14_0_20_36_20 TaxID=1974477 RepID=A0A2H0NC66_9BACT|nr:MAG: cell filamentation protein Fic [Candidatus Komeilibacteria bacterium CG11_big_fil_rev_8_21_14_0_20_36_20]PIR81746.1 MAG: cell filamentation protein Fic [Candidatus Komeilibacteria bacterium CG10_big_fil_rev_8_21_14_0_10_36_65]PJC55563.1 MAG: cell filamentation protein Fic [Candidatus Komeilibacteria bacterium CG_4_9_14_0_2_um_filter_36_13]